MVALKSSGAFGELELLAGRVGVRLIAPDDGDIKGVQCAFVAESGRQCGGFAFTDRCHGQCTDHWRSIGHRHLWREHNSLVDNIVRRACDVLTVPHCHRDGVVSILQILVLQLCRMRKSSCRGWIVGVRVIVQHFEATSVCRSVGICRIDGIAPVNCHGDGVFESRFDNAAGQRHRVVFDDCRGVVDLRLQAQIHQRWRDVVHRQAGAGSGGCGQLTVADRQVNRNTAGRATVNSQFPQLRPGQIEFRRIGGQEGEIRIVRRLAVDRPIVGQPIHVQC